MLLDGAYDLVLHERVGAYVEPTGVAPPDTLTSIAPDLVVGRLPEADVDAISATCSPRMLLGGGVTVPERVWSQQYAILRQNPPSDWDSDQEVQCVIALSRLVHPTSMCLRYAAGVRYENGKLVTVNPADPIGIGRGAWHPKGVTRDWLSEAEWRQAGQLCQQRPFDVQDRWYRAMWCFEYMSRTFDFAVRSTLCVTSLEALVHIWYPRQQPGHARAPGSTRQFVDRTAGLARRIGITGWDADVAERAYEVRSSFSHGRSGVPISDSLIESTMESAEALLRGSLLECVVNPQFRALVNDDAQLEKLIP